METAEQKSAREALASTLAAKLAGISDPVQVAADQIIAILAPLSADQKIAVMTALKGRPL